MAGTMQTSGSSRVLADHVIGLDKGGHVLEYQGSFFFENGELLRDEEIAKSLPERFREKAVEFVSKQKAGGPEAQVGAPMAPTQPGPAQPDQGTPHVSPVAPLPSGPTAGYPAATVPESGTPEPPLRIPPER